MTKVVSLFSGGGGLDLGFKRQGYDIIWAIDFNKDAVETYRKNIGDHIICQDITKIDPNDVPDCDVIIGGPPCQAFSLAGKRDSEDDRAKLVWSYLDFIRVKAPKAFVFENVPGLLSAKTPEGTKVIDDLSDAFNVLGYRLSKQILNAADYGVPQRRKRVILVGIKDRSFSFPSPTHSENGIGGLKPYVSVSDALSDITSLPSKDLAYVSDPSTDYQKMMRMDSHFLHDHESSSISELDRYIISHVPPGGNYMNIPDDVSSKRIQRLKKEGGRTTYYGRMHPDEPSYTINTYFNRPNVGCNIHYSEDRFITPREALRLQSFPDNFEIVASSKQSRNLIIGNAVPPLLSEAIAKELKNYV